MKRALLTLAAMACTLRYRLGFARLMILAAVAGYRIAADLMPSQKCQAGILPRIRTNGSRELTIEKPITSTLDACPEAATGDDCCDFQPSAYPDVNDWLQSPEKHCTAIIRPVTSRLNLILISAALGRWQICQSRDNVMVASKINRGRLAILTIIGIHNKILQIRLLSYRWPGARAAVPGPRINFWEF